MNPWQSEEDVRVSDAASRIGQGHDGKGDLWVTYDLRGWVVTLRAQAGAPFDGPQELRLQLDMSVSEGEQGEPATAESGGITADLLRSVPLNDARKVLRRLRTELLASRDAGAYNLPPRMIGRGDWIAFARAYARSAARNPQQPIVHLARATGLSMNTINARLRRAQEMGLLERQEGTTWLVLSSEARASSAEA